MLEKLSWFLLDWFNNTGAIYVKMNGSAVKEKLSFKKMGLAGTFGSLSKCSQLKSFLKVLLWQMFMGTGSTASTFLDVTRMPISIVSFVTPLDLEVLCQQNAFLWPFI